MQSDVFTGWLYEAGIGENRAAHVVSGQLMAVRVEREQSRAIAGSIIDACFTEQWVAGRSGIATLTSGEQCLLQPVPKGLTEGAMLRVEITRAAWDEPGGQSKRAKAKAAPDGTLLSPGPQLLDIIQATGDTVRPIHAQEVDHLSQLGWHEAMEQAESGRIDFSGGTLLLSVTPAMTVIDVDGSLAPFALAKEAAKQVAEALRYFDIGGSIGVDFPSLQSKAERTEICQIFDDHMFGNCERTAINGFGFMQIVARKKRSSILEIMQRNKVLNAALALLRQAERSSGSGPLQLVVHPAIAASFRQKSEWLDILSQRTGRQVSVQSAGEVGLHSGQIK
ncbi:MAG: ribonuclease E/G [Parasphingorhabdus sp.]|uniref:ribonuclease E/G n=1 Tax=Parasphingorhabdus sp. TaxID=2709688 RepID=UPI003297B0A2